MLPAMADSSATLTPRRAWMFLPPPTYKASTIKLSDVMRASCQIV